MRQSTRVETANTLGLDSQPKVEQLNSVGGVAITTVKEFGELPAGRMAGVVCLLQITETAMKVGEDKYTHRKPVCLSWNTYRKQSGWNRQPTNYTAIPQSLCDLGPANQAMAAGAITALAQELQSFDISLDLDNAATPIPYCGEVILPQEI